MRPQRVAQTHTMGLMLPSVSIYLFILVVLLLLDCCLSPVVVFFVVFCLVCLVFNFLIHLHTAMAHNALLRLDFPCCAFEFNATPPPAAAMAVCKTVAKRNHWHTTTAMDGNISNKSCRKRTEKWISSFVRFFPSLVYFHSFNFIHYVMFVWNVHTHSQDVINQCNAFCKCSRAHTTQTWFMRQKQQ